MLEVSPADVEFFFQIYPTSTTALLKSSDSPVLVCCETAPGQPLICRKLLLSHSELSALAGGVLGAVQATQQALNDENDKRDMYKVKFLLLLTNLKKKKFTQRVRNGTLLLSLRCLHF